MSNSKAYSLEAKKSTRLVKWEIVSFLSENLRSQKNSMKKISFSLI